MRADYLGMPWTKSELQNATRVTFQTATVNQRQDNPRGFITVSLLPYAEPRT